MPLTEQTKERARQLRRAETPEEKTLWYRLRGGRLLGHKFRRQHPIPPYFADFACVELMLMLIIEIDGAGHQNKVASDARRDQYLRDLKWNVLRIGKDDVVLRLHPVLDAIVFEIDRILRGRASPSP